MSWVIVLLVIDVVVVLLLLWIHIIICLYELWRPLDPQLDQVDGFNG